MPTDRVDGGRAFDTAIQQPGSYVGASRRGRIMAGQRSSTWLGALALVALLLSPSAKPGGCLWSAVQADKVEVTISLEKDTFFVSEPVWVDLYFTNEGRESVTLNSLDLTWQKLGVHVVNSAGDTLEYSGFIADGVCPPGPTLEASETYYHCIDLSENFGKGAREYLPPSLRYLEEGTYTLQMTHTGVSSNLAEFKVENPKGEEGLACHLVKEASRSGFEYYHTDIQQVIDIFQVLVSKYPKSAYADLGHYEIAGLHGLLDQPSETNEHLRSLILDYPNSHFVIKALPALLQQMTKDQNTEFLKEIIKRHPETRASDLAQQSLEYLEEEEKPKE